MRERSRLAKKTADTMLGYCYENGIERNEQKVVKLYQRQPNKEISEHNLCLAIIMRMELEYKVNPVKINFFEFHTIFFGL